MKCRCQNPLVKAAVENGVVVVVRMRLVFPKALKKSLLTNGDTLIVDLGAGWMYFPDGGKRVFESGGAFKFRWKNANDVKHVYEAGFRSAILSGKKTATLFVGKKQVNRFTDDFYENEEEADRADVWHWMNLQEAFGIFKVWAKENPAPGWPLANISRTSCAYQDALSRVTQWNERRQAFFRSAVHPKLLHSLSYFADFDGDTPCYVVCGNRRDLECYIENTRKSLHHHSRKQPSQHYLQNQIMKGEWPSVSARLQPYFKTAQEAAIVKAIKRAVSVGAMSTAAARGWFQKMNAINLLGDWARREQKARKHNLESNT